MKAEKGKAAELDFAFKIRMYDFCIAIGAFDKADLMRNLQPYARVAKAAVATITGNAPVVNNAGFWGWRGHHVTCLLAAGRYGP
ncbi:hypothetical protein SAMN04488005_2147 [Yoonia tamlensis]|uniref:Uncharacterized protein n=1 Tax=Yoonia tamlensis TaxID=390270 RepID=A0A1I6GTQ8_9RHOB|nr:hypothetical protein SAMN04488005_2147 [Yoonia tamlensis]